jgi:hypothetical protein
MQEISTTISVSPYMVFTNRMKFLHILFPRHWCSRARIIMGQDPEEFFTSYKFVKLEPCSAKIWHCTYVYVDMNK